MTRERWCTLTENAAEEAITSWVAGGAVSALRTLDDMIDNLDDQLKAMRSMREIITNPEIPGLKTLWEIRNSYRNQDGSN
jgi:hypothetical protein